MKRKLVVLNLCVLLALFNLLSANASNSRENQNNDYSDQIEKVEKVEKGKSYEKYPRNNVWSALGSNFRRTLPFAFYTLLGAATQIKNFPHVGQLHWGIPTTFFLANAYAKIDTTKEVMRDDNERARKQNEIMAEYIINGGLSTLAAVGVHYAAANAIPIIMAFIATDFLAAGDNSPIEYIKSMFSSGLNTIRGVE